ncbi:MAG: hypothetical protein KME57_09015 [Scytonema hyalinum WJT4-NPBG1]|jgi:hypothetical protein|nr:hypothetical protein [Scytonema hyalinum WJT4-NPBG1]
MTPQLLKRPIQSLSSVAAGAVLFLTASSLSVQAITLVTNRDNLEANDKIDWSSLEIGTPINLTPITANLLPNSFQTTSEKGLGLSVDIPSIADPRYTPPFVFQTTPTLPANFSNGDYILFTGFIPGGFPALGNPGPLTITFDQPVQGAGTQIAVDDTLNFTAFISAFDDNNNLLGSFSTPGTSATVLDNSAVFLGVRSASANISKLVYSSSENNRAFGINFLSINSTTIPEPGNLLALSLLGIGRLTVRKMKS